MMEFCNDTPFTFAPITGQINYPNYSLTLVIKGTFSLANDSAPKLAETQRYPCGDEYYPDDEEGKGSVRYASDFVYAKTANERFLVGHCQGPSALPVRQVDFMVGAFAKSLVVVGDRYWKTSTKYSDPEPFLRMPLRYENSLGGSSSKENPVGKGIGKSSATNKVALPNIEYCDQPIVSINSRPPMAGFGPINPNWKSRRNKLGSYGKRYLQKRWPWFPEDFDWRYFNAAPKDQQSKDPIVGDEPLLVTNMHPEHSEYKSCLPALRVRCFLNKKEGMQRKHFNEVPVNLDTLWLDMDDETMVLVWRGWKDVKDEDCSNYSHCFIFAEPTSIETDISVIHRRFLRWIEDTDEDDRTRLAPMRRAKPASDDKLDEVEKDLNQIKQALKAKLVSQGVAPEMVDQTFQKNEEEAEEFLQQQAQDTIWNRDLVLLMIEQRKALDDSVLSGLDLSNINFHGISMQRVDLTQANLKGVNISGCNLQGSLLAESTFEKSLCVETDFSNSDLFKVNMAQCNLAKANFSNAFCDQSNFDLCQAQACVMVGASLVESSFSKSNLQGSDLSGADFSSARVTEVNFSLCNMQDTTISGAIGERVNFEKAKLRKLRASSVNLSPGSCFVECEADESIWNEANLTACDFRYGSFKRANFVGAKLNNANFSAVNAKFARLSQADLTMAQVALTNLFDANLAKSTLVDTDFKGANLFGCEFWQSKIVNCDFEMANLGRTKLIPGGLMHDK